MKRWLVKHWWVNETGKALAASFFGVIVYSLYSKGGKEAAFLAGVLFVMCMCIAIDVVTVLIRKIMGKAPYGY